jgi:hypothetical protein
MGGAARFGLLLSVLFHFGKNGLRELAPKSRLTHLYLNVFIGSLTWYGADQETLRRFV